MTEPKDVASDFLTMGISWQTVAELAKPTPQDQIRTKPGRGGSGALSYVDARYVMKRLDEICGPYWQRDHRMEGEKVACGIGILIDGQWIWRWDGAGETDIEGEKGSFSDAFKRAAVSWGVARDLYPEPGATGSQRSPPSAPAASGSEVCPKHGTPWRDGKYGKFCSQKDPNGKRGYCEEHP